MKKLNLLIQKTKDFFKDFSAKHFMIGLSLNFPLNFLDKFIDEYAVYQITLQQGPHFIGTPSTVPGVALEAFIKSFDLAVHFLYMLKHHPFGEKFVIICLLLSISFLVLYSICKKKLYLYGYLSSLLLSIYFGVFIYPFIFPFLDY